MNFIWNTSTPVGNVVLTSIFGLAIMGGVFYILFRVTNRKTSLIAYGIISFIIILSYIFDLPYITCLGIILLGISVLLSLFINLGDLRKFLANPFKVRQAKVTTHKVEKIFDSEAMHKQVESAVIALSKSKIGALITFERNTSLADLSKNGVDIKAPVSSELLQTIFYPGTRLHDGAVIIKGNEIAAASVFFTPTTKAFAGKYGSRHRAAIGISEVSDAVTVVVSEETGRISFAVNGTLETVDQTNFLRVFENLLQDKESK